MCVIQLNLFIHSITLTQKKLYCQLYVSVHVYEFGLQKSSLNILLQLKCSAYFFNRDPTFDFHRKRMTFQ